MVNGQPGGMFQRSSLRRGKRRPRLCHRAWLFLLALLLLSAACSDGAQPAGEGSHVPPLCGADAVEVTTEVTSHGEELLICNRHISLRYDLARGTFSVGGSPSGPWVVSNAEGLALSRALLPGTRWHSSDMYESAWRARPVSTPLGRGKSVIVARRSVDGGMPSLEQDFTALDGQGCLILRVTLINTTEHPLPVGTLYPLSTQRPSAGLDLGLASDIRILTNGVLDYLDFVVPIYPGTMASFSNWSSLFYNLVTGKSLMVGSLSFEKAQSIVFSAPASGTGPGMVLQAGSQYDPATTLSPGEGLASETIVLECGQGDPLGALEGYADRLKAWLGIRTWTERHPDVGVPAGWNSWSGGSSSGGYGTDIDEAIIVENMDFADRELRRWGMTHFQIDDGWQDRAGDWGVNTARFPDHGDENGIQWVLHRAQALGFRTGLWIRAFDAEPGARILEEHPEWFAEPILGGLLGSAEEHHLDVSNPAVRDHLVALMKRLRHWGIQWLKLDFAYRVMLTQGWYDPSLTRFQFYRNGIELLRAALGEDVFFLNVALVGHNAGLVDSLRLTLDTMPAWEGTSQDPYNPLSVIDNQGLKPMYRDAARRYYLNGRIWVNHPDLIFFRSHTDPTIPPLSLNESKTFATSVALQGGVLKLGDRLVDLGPEAVDTIRRILPVYGRSGRPLDLLRREFPEVWSLPVHDFDEPYHVLGILNWGLNKDLTTLPPQWLPDTEREIVVDLAEAGCDPHQTYLAFESWGQEFLGEVQGRIALRVPARTPRVVTLRTRLGRPQFLGTNRHVLGGVKVVRSLAWDPSSSTLTGVQEGSVGTPYAPFEHRITLYVPDTYEVEGFSVAPPEGYDIEGQSISREGSIATLRFTVTEPPEASRSCPACVHPEVTWSVHFRSGDR
jgi:alpha-galactosidase